MNPQLNDVFHDYIRVLELAIRDLRARIRYEDDVTMQEVHDLLDAIHNIPILLRSPGGWYVPENIDSALGRYDAKWIGTGNAKLRTSLMEYLRMVRAGDYDYDGEMAPSSPSSGK
jgi:hypothetical protein